jgi:hypothetical protein
VIYGIAFLPAVYLFRDLSAGSNFRQTALTCLTVLLMLCGGINSSLYFRHNFEPMGVKGQIRFAESMLQDSGGKPFVFKPQKRWLFYRDVTHNLLNKPWNAVSQADITYYWYDSEDSNPEITNIQQKGVLVSGNDRFAIYRLK